MLKKWIAVPLAALFLLSAPLATLAAGNTGGTDSRWATDGWPLGQALPHFGEPTRALDGVRVKDRPFAERLAVGCLQGIVNRTEPLLFVQDDADSWPADLGLTVNMLPDWLAAVTKYKEKLSGLVIYNPAVPETANVATTIAGLTDALPVSPEQAELLSAAPYALAVVKDLRDEAAITDKLSAYRYLYDQYWDQCTRRAICGLLPDNHTQLRDFAVAAKTAVVWLDPKIPEEREVLELFFRDSKPIDTYYTGWWPDEGEGVAFASRYGVMTIASDFYENYTVYSGMSQVLDVPAVPAKPALKNGKIYVSLNLSDGDNIQYDEHFMRMLWSSPERGKVPIGWTATPALLDAGPQLLNYYYKTATDNDVLICGPSGLGYSSASNWPNKDVVRQYAAITNRYFERTGFDVITVWVGMPMYRANWFAESCPSLLGMTVQDGTGLRIRFTDSKIPVVWLGSDVKNSTGAMSYDPGNSNMKMRLSDAAADYQASGSTRPRFYIGQASAWDTRVPDFVRLAEELDAEFPDTFVFVRPDHFMLLLNEAYGKPFLASLQKPAEASSSLRIPIPDTGLTTEYDAAKAFDGSVSTSWQALDPGKAWISVDLGENFCLDRYVLKNAEAGGAAPGENTKTWKLQVSANGKDWRTADSVKGNDKAVVYRDLCGQRARYVRLLVEDPGGSCARVQDLEIYGTAQNAANQAYGFFYSIANFFANLVFDIADKFTRQFLQ
ncbi:MAG: discoidin domain-containing protein [Oscillospiraceae bacterium]|jgi:hypothetical protein|nr:discoidin domain-containing protein [Oscillospiraceae bacterium]